MQTVPAPAASVVTGQVVVTLESATATFRRVCVPVLVTPKLKVIWSPASTRPFVLTSTGVPADLLRRSEVTTVVGVVAEAAFEATAAPFGPVAEAAAVLVTAPASASAWVIVYAPLEHEVEAPGASVVEVQVTGPTFASVTTTPVRVSAPAFVTVKAYETRSPVSVRPFPLASTGAPAVLVRVSVVTVLVGVAVAAAFDVTAVPAGLRPVAVAVLFTAPASTSAWVIVYAVVVVQVVLAPAARVDAMQVVGPTFASAMASVETVTVPVFVTPKV
ncbi:hypothetical protein GCM10009593_29430 [Microlunatus antarcticus]